MAEQNLDQLGIQTINVPNFELGIITSAPATEIPNNAVQDMVNWEFDDTGNVSTRAGLIALMATTFPSRFTSAHHFTVETGEVGLLFTTADELYIVETDGTGLTDLTGSLTLPSDRFWQWVTFDGEAIGTNGATTGDNPIKVTDSAVASALGGGGGTAPKARYCTVWNNRVWMAGGEALNTLWGSALNNAEEWDFTAGGADDAYENEVEAGDGDQIMGLKATKDALYIFKRKRTFRVVPINPAEPATDATNLKVELFSPGVGCVSGYSIGEMLDDLVFLSEYGIASLEQSQNVEDFRNKLLSRNISEIQRMAKTTDEIPAIVMDTASQYWLSVPSTISPTGGAQVYVMDYSLKPFPDGFVRWCRFNGKVAGTAYTSWTDDVGKVFVIGAPNGAGQHQLYIYRPKDYDAAFSDDGTAYTKKIITKAYAAGEALLDKDWLKWGLALGLLTDSVQLAVQYYFDRVLTKGGTYPGFSLTGNTSGARWDSAIWDESLWDSAVSIPQDIWRELLVNSSGQIAQDITFVFTNAQDSEGLQIKDFKILYSLLNELEVSEI